MTMGATLLVIEDSAEKRVIDAKLKELESESIKKDKCTHTC